MKEQMIIFLATLFFFTVSLAFTPEVSPDNHEVGFAAEHIDSGLAAMRRGDLYTAKGEFEFVLRSQYHSFKSVAYLNLGVITFMEGNPDLAIQYYHSAIQLRPDYAEAYFNLGGAYYKQGNLKMAEEAFLKAIEFQANYGRAHYSLGSVYFDQTKYDLARKHADKAHEYGIPYETLKEKLAKVGK